MSDLTCDIHLLIARGSVACRAPALITLGVALPPSGKSVFHHHFHDFTAFIHGHQAFPCPDKALHLPKFGRAGVRLHVSLGNVPEINRIKSALSTILFRVSSKAKVFAIWHNLCQLSCCWVINLISDSMRLYKPWVCFSTLASEAKWLWVR